MPQISVNGVTLAYVDTGGPGEVIVFSHGFLMSHALFAPQIAALKDEYRCVAYDHRGQAGSEVTDGGYDIDTITEDAAALMKALDLGPCHFVGLSMGGFAGMRLALRHPELLKSLVLLDTSADSEPSASKRQYKMLAMVVRVFGLRPVVGKIMSILFGKTFMADPNRAEDRAQWRNHLLTGHVTKGVLRALTGVIERDSVYDQLGSITVPSLVMVGREDVATVPAKGKRIADAIPGATFLLIDGAGHSATVEQPDRVNAAIKNFLEG